jgi:hypothetical protein
MGNRGHFELRYGPYKSPVTKPGEPMDCEIRGSVRVVGMSDSPIPWPYSSFGALIVCGDLARAVRNEATVAVAHHWGVTQPTVSRWRRSLGVGRFNRGSRALRREVASLSHVRRSDPNLSASQPPVRSPNWSTEENSPAHHTPAPNTPPDEIKRERSPVRPLVAPPQSKP